MKQIETAQGKWRKDTSGNWYVEGSFGLQEGDQITIRKRDGTIQERTVVQVIKNGDYKVNSEKTYVDLGFNGCGCECGNTERWRNSNRCTQCGEKEN